MTASTNVSPSIPLLRVVLRAELVRDAVAQELVRDPDLSHRRLAELLDDFGEVAACDHASAVWFAQSLPYPNVQSDLALVGRLTPADLTSSTAIPSHGPLAALLKIWAEHSPRAAPQDDHSEAAPDLRALLWLAQRHFARDPRTFRRVVDLAFPTADHDRGIGATRALDRPLRLATSVDEQLWRSVMGDLTALAPLERVVLDQRILRSDGPVTLRAIADEVNLSRERIRQIETSVAERLSAIWQRSETVTNLRLLAHRITLDVGLVCTPEALGQAVERAVRATSSSDVSEAEVAQREALLRLLTGGWTETAQMLHHRDAAPIIEHHRRGIDHADEPLPLNIVGDLIRDLHASAEIQPHLEELLSLRLFGDRWIRWGGGLHDKAIAVLRLRGTPASFDELHELVGFDANPRSLANAVSADPRLRKLGKDRWGLSEWGGEEYEGIRTELVQALERAGGPLRLEPLVQRFATAFGVSENSVRAYAQGHDFVLLPDGHVGLREAHHPEPSVRTSAPAMVRGLSRLDDAWHLRVDVDFDVLRGSGRPMRIGAAVTAGLEPGLVFAIHYVGSPVTFSWRAKQPSLGSVRPVVMALGAIDGDLLFLPLEGSEPRAGRLIRGDRLRAATGLDRLALELGEPDGPGAFERVLRALDLPVGAHIDDVSDRLRERGEASLAAIVGHP